MALCLAHSLLYRQGFDPVDQMNRYCNWYNYGYLSSTGTCFDIGNATAQSLRSFLEHNNPFAGSTASDTAGNGGLMRLAPVPMFYARNPAAVLLYAGESTRTTHGAPEALECSRLFGLQLLAALRGGSKEEILAVAYPEPLSANVARIANRSYLDKPIDQIKGSGYCVASLEAALWCFWRSGSFREAVLMAANLGDDADTTAAICGQLAGAFYGIQGVPAQWVDKIAMGGDIIGLADRLLAERASAQCGTGS